MTHKEESKVEVTPVVLGMERRNFVFLGAIFSAMYYILVGLIQSSL